jgi:cytochrome c oxidase assembly protein subunit 15
MARALETPASNSWLHRFAVLTAAATLCLLGAGGLVTSHGVGMAVPDWPNTYGYNMFFFPVSRWVGGIFYEHSHRLLASGVGLLTAVLALWVYGKSSRVFLRWTGAVVAAAALATFLGAPQRWRDGLVLAVMGVSAFGASWVWPRGEASHKWVRRLGLAAFLAVVLQGVLGGLRVVLFKDQLGIFHATLAQLFFALTCALALLTSRWWLQGKNPKSSRKTERSPKHSPITKSRDEKNESSLEPESPRIISDLSLHWLRWLCIATTCVIFAQLVLGATMRHQHAGLAIPDFPLAYGKLWPAMDAQSVARYNQHRVEVVDENAITGFQIGLQMAHRITAVLILGMVGYGAWLTRRKLGKSAVSSRLASAWLVVILLQALLGVATIWTNKAADVATAHVLVGALALASGVLLSLVSWREASVGARFEPGLQKYRDSLDGISGHGDSPLLPVGRSA